MMARKDFVAVHFPVLELRMEGCVGGGRGGEEGDGSPWRFVVVMAVGVNDVMIGSRKRKTTKFPTTNMFMRHTMRQNTEGGAWKCINPCSEDGGG